MTTLTIHRVEYEDAGDYVCIGINNVDSTEETINFKVECESSHRSIKSRTIDKPISGLVFIQSFIFQNIEFAILLLIESDSTYIV